MRKIFVFIVLFFIWIPLLQAEETLEHCNIQEVKRWLQWIWRVNIENSMNQTMPSAKISIDEALDRLLRQKEGQINEEYLQYINAIAHKILQKIPKLYKSYEGASDTQLILQYILVRTQEKLNNIKINICEETSKISYFNIWNEWGYMHFPNPSQYITPTWESIIMPKERNISHIYIDEGGNNGYFTTSEVSHEIELLFSSDVQQVEVIWNNKWDFWKVFNYSLLWPEKEIIFTARTEEKYESQHNAKLGKNEYLVRAYAPGNIYERIVYVTFVDDNAQGKFREITQYDPINFNPPYEYPEGFYDTSSYIIDSKNSYHYHPWVWKHDLYLAYSTLTFVNKFSNAEQSYLKIKSDVWTELIIEGYNQASQLKEYYNWDIMFISKRFESPTYYRYFDASAWKIYNIFDFIENSWIEKPSYYNTTQVKGDIITISWWKYWDWAHANAYEIKIDTKTMKVISEETLN